MSLRVFFTESCLSCGYARNIGFTPKHHLNAVWNEVCLFCSNDCKDTKPHITLAFTEEVKDSFVDYEQQEELSLV